MASSVLMKIRNIVLRLPLGSELFRSAVLLMPQATHYIARELKNASSMIDLGCGDSSPLSFSGTAGYSVGVDLTDEYLRSSKGRGIHSDYVKSHICTTAFRAKSADVALALDVIEHLPKAEGYKLIQEMERIARSKVVIITPNGFSPKIHLEHDNPLQAHKSGWVLEDFSMFGYEVKGVFGLRCLRGERATPKLKPMWLGLVVSWLTQNFVETRPKLAHSLMCIKNLSVNSNFNSTRTMQT